MCLVNENFDLTLYEDSDELVAATAREAVELIRQQLKNKGVCHIALTGGTLGRQFAQRFVEILNSQSRGFNGLHVWFSDERFDSAESSLRNAKPVHDGLRNTSVIVHEVQSSGGASSVGQAADSYAQELPENSMDLCILGLGADGHVASLFPNHWEISVKAKAYAVVDSPKPPPERVSFSMGFINASTQVWVIAAGEAKAAAVTRILAEDLSIPAAHVAGRELTRLIIDTSAFFTE